MKLSQFIWLIFIIKITQIYNNLSDINENSSSLKNTDNFKVKKSINNLKRKEI